MKRVHASSGGVEMGCASKGHNGELVFRGTLEFVAEKAPRSSVVRAYPNEPPSAVGCEYRCQGWRFGSKEPTIDSGGDSVALLPQLLLTHPV